MRWLRREKLLPTLVLLLATFNLLLLVVEGHTQDSATYQMQCGINYAGKTLVSSSYILYSSSDYAQDYVSSNTFGMQVNSPFYLPTTIGSGGLPDVPENPPLEIPTFTPPTIMQFWVEGDLFGFFQALFGAAFMGADVFFAFVALIVSMAIYIRTKSLILLTILALVTLGAGFMVAMPLVSGFGVLLMIFGVSGLLHQIYSSRSS